jgi:acyl-coenzyme A synthetase/AMP-(fatty) acid ligase
MRLWLASGNTLPSALQSNFSRHVGLPLHEIFGATETGVIAANSGCGAKQIGSFGRAAPGSCRRGHRFEWGPPYCSALKVK